MGAKITVDSASMMNKGLELIEAVWLFDVHPDMIDIVVHRESIIHSLIEYNDNSVIAQLGVPDMRIPIQYALTYPDRMPSCLEPLDFKKVGRLTFDVPDEETFTLLPLARRCVKAGGVMTAVLNGANEAAVAAFLEDRIGFTAMFDLVEAVVDDAEQVENPTLDDIQAVDIAAREAVQRRLNR
jgi:1-deoxy-D-xylulose-5-phosphate reductoisomerase